jgi:hypothetical protein
VDLNLRTLSLAYGGSSITSAPLAYGRAGNGVGGPTGPLAPQSLSVTFGINYEQGPALPMIFRYDNLLIDPVP